MKAKAAILTCALLVVGWSFGAAAFTLPTDCTYVYNTQSGFDPVGTSIFSSGFPMLALNPGVFTVPWPEVDMELIEGQVTIGDGIPDNYQLAMLGAALCDGDAALLAQFNTNLARYDAFLSGFHDFQIWGIPNKAPMDALNNTIAGWASGLPDGALKTTALDIAHRLHEAHHAFVIPDGLPPGTIEAVFEELAQARTWFAGMAGLSTGMRTAMLDMVDTTGIHVVDWNLLANDLTLLGATPQPPMDASLADQIAAMAATVTEGAALFQAARPPDFVIYGVARKTADEPFSASGDFNDDGVTNLEVYNEVHGPGLGRDVFIEWATASSTPPQLPVIGMPGLVLLLVASASYGVRRLRRH